MQHTATTLQAACADIARSIGPDAKANITVGHAGACGNVYVAVYPDKYGANMRLCYGDDFDAALAAARRIAQEITDKANAADREYASWVQPVLMAAE